MKEPSMQSPSLRKNFAKVHELCSTSCWSHCVRKNVWVCVITLINVWKHVWVAYSNNFARVAAYSALYLQFSSAVGFLMCTQVFLVKCPCLRMLDSRSTSWIKGFWFFSSGPFHFRLQHSIPFQDSFHLTLDSILRLCPSYEVKHFTLHSILHLCPSCETNAVCVHQILYSLKRKKKTL